ncbi:MAG: hypothetical protein QOH26_1296 [Actinomycetota bacterium]|nr:hypothetical protein [Actinomycetota bacterium]
MTKLIEPAVAAAVARRVAGSAEAAHPERLDRLRADLERAVPRSEELVAEVSGIASPPPVRWGILDRAGWAEANIAGMSSLIEPLVDKLGKRLDALPLPIRIAQRTVVSVEIGGILGYISRRVLGQYDLLVPENPDGSVSRRLRRITGDASLYFVGANMVETQQKLRFVPEDFALWVAVHEVTHRFQFAGVPWLRDHFFGLVGSYMETLEMDAKHLTQRVATAAKRLLAKDTAPEERNAVYLFADNSQRQILDQLQALMAVVEGHGNFVMDTVGEAVIPSFKGMRSMFQRRREQTKLIQRAVNHIIGLEMKLRQYELGQQFCEAATQRGGRDALSHLWADPSNLPTMAELRAPETWLARVA